MLERAQVSAGDTVLITGASGGVGSALIQLVNRRSATSIALSSQPQMDELKALSAHHVIDRDVTNLKQP